MRKRMSYRAGHVNVVVALSCEAKPLIKHFNLKRTSDRAGFKVYENDQDITLIVSGIGKTAMATACGYLAGLQNNSRLSKSAWLNMGIAGHQHAPIGKLLLVHKVTDSERDNVFYPPLLLDIDCETTDLISVDTPETEYIDNSAYDMEGSAFYSTASRFVTSELVQVVKIVSDNSDQSAEHVTESKIQGWVRENLKLIVDIVEQLLSMSAEYQSIYSPSNEFQELADKVYLTSSQQVQLKRLVRRYHALGGTELHNRLKPECYKSAKSVINSLTLLVEAI